MSRSNEKRLWNQLPVTLNFALTTDTPISSAQVASHIETPTGSASVFDGVLNESITGNQIKTFILYVNGID